MPVLAPACNPPRERRADGAGGRRVAVCGYQAGAASRLTVMTWL